MRFAPLVIALLTYVPANGQSLSVSTLAGTPGVAGQTDGAARDALFRYPFGVTVDDAGTVYVAMQNCVRSISTDRQVHTVAGDCGKAGYLDGSASSALFTTLFGITVDGAGNLYVCDRGNYVVRRIGVDGTVTTLAGTAGSQAMGGPYDPARFIGPISIAFGPDGTLYVGDFYIPPVEGDPTGGAAIRTVGPGGVITTVAGGAYLGHRDGAGAMAVFFAPAGITFDANGTMLITDWTTVRTMTSDGKVGTLAGRSGFGGDPAVGTARFDDASGIATDSNGAVYVVDTQLNTIQCVAADGSARVIAGVTSVVAGSTDGTGPEATLHEPYGLAISRAGRFYVADAYNHTVREGVITRDGDTNGDGQLTAADIFYLINHVFVGGAAPIGSGDANHDNSVGVGDVFYLVNYLFANGTPP